MNQQELLRKIAERLYYFEGRNTAVVANSAAEAKKKKKRGGDKIVKVRSPSDSEKKQMAAGRWVRTRADGKPPGKSKVEGQGYGPPLGKKKSNNND